MTMTEIRIKALVLGINPGKIKKAELIRAIQQAENYTPCFGTSNTLCVKTDCCFFTDCVKLVPC